MKLFLVYFCKNTQRMNEPIKMGIPVQAYIYKYVVGRLGTDTLKVTSRNPWGAFLASFFSASIEKAPELGNFELIDSSSQGQMVWIELVHNNSFVINRKTVRLFEAFEEVAFRHD